jgi:F5/8 type C domain/Dolichyl-phosphate-mannose-protein mannosyltransferase
VVTHTVAPVRHSGLPIPSPLASPSALNAPGRRIILLLLLVIAIGAYLRFAGLSWGLRHAPDWDERAFVDNVAAMVRNGDLDQRFYEYPGLFFYLLYPALAVLPPASPPGPLAYLVARGVVAGFGVASLALVYVLGRRLAGPRGGLAAALFLALSPIEVSTAHMVRPDVVLEAFALVALLAFRRVGTETKGDVMAGLALGAAASVKFTGVLLLPSYLLTRWLEPGRKGRGLAIALATAALVGVVTTPSAVLNTAEYMGGLYTQWAYHYAGATVGSRFDDISLYYLWTLARSLGPAGCVLGLAGLWLGRRRAREWGPTLLFPLVLLVVLSTAQARWIRLLVPALGAAGIAGALGFEALLARFPRAAWGILVVGSLVPLADSADYVAAVQRPGTRDRVLDWVETNVPPGTHVLTSMRDMGFDTRRLEVVFSRGVAAEDDLIARDAGAVVWAGLPPDALSASAPVFVAEPVEPRIEGPRIAVYRPTVAPETRWRSVPIQGARLRSSSNQEEIGAAADGRLDTYWKTASADVASEWVQVELPAPARLCRVELLLGYRPNRAGRRLRVSVSDDGANWRPIVSAPGRTDVELQMGLEEGKASQVLLVAPTLTRWVRITAGSAPGRRWGFAELRLEAGGPISESPGR